MKKMLIGFAVLAAGALMLTGCGGKQEAPAQAAAAAEAQPQVNIRISVANSLDHPQTLGLGLMKKYVEEKSGGKVTVAIYPNSQLGSEMESLEQVQNGTLEMATASIAPIATFQDKFAVMDIPFLFADYNQAWAVLDSMTGQTLMSTLEEVKMKGLAWMENGYRHTTNSVKPIKTAADFKGLKIRTMEAPNHMASFSALGANPTPVPYSELYLALSQKVVDGQENPLANIWDLNMYEAQKYVSLTGHIYDTTPLICNLEWFAKLPGNYQRIIEVGALLGQNYSRFVNADREAAIVTALQAKGMEINSLTPAALDEIKNISQPAVVKAIGDKVDQAFIQSFMDGIKAVDADIVKSVTTK
jgi:tripartite ATP-independent transporter DctP family solute receptor